MSQATSWVVVICVFALGCIAGIAAERVERHNIKHEVLGKDKYLTTDDLKAIFDCIDTKITNIDRKNQFPCIAVRGDTIM